MREPRHTSQARARELALARQARTAALVMAGTMMLWMFAQILGSVLDWHWRYVFLFDFAALAGLVWALAVTYQIWRMRRDSDDRR